MEVTDKLKDYSYRKICDDCLKKKRLLPNIEDSSFIAVCLSVMSLFHTSEEGQNLLKYDSKEESVKFQFFYMFSDYVMFLFRNKRCYSSNLQLFWSCYSCILRFLEINI